MDIITVYIKYIEGNPLTTKPTNSNIMTYTLSLTTVEQTICDLLVTPIDLAASTTEQIKDYLLILGCDLTDMYWFNQNQCLVGSHQIDKKAQGQLLVKVETALKALPA